MHKSNLFLGLAFLMAGALGAAPIACPTGTAQTYITTVNAAGGCTEDGLLFSQFNYIATAAGTAIALPATALGIAPLLNPAGTGFGFQIVGGFAAGPGGVADGIVQYEVSTLDSSHTLDDLSLTFNGTSTGTGIAVVSENYCVGGTAVPPTTCASGLSNVSVQSSTGVSKLQTSATFAPASSVTVSKDIQVNGGTAGTATISSVTNQFSTVPEPATIFLVSGAILAYAAFRRRRATAL